MIGCRMNNLFPQYFFNSQTQQYLLWNAQTMTYTVVPPAAPAPPAAPPVPELVPQPPPPRSAEEEAAKALEAEKERQARKIVQDMEKWAKSQNVRTAQKPKPAPPPPEVKIGVVASVFKDDDEESAQPEVLHGVRLNLIKLIFPCFTERGDLFCYCTICPKGIRVLLSDWSQNNILFVEK